MKAIVLAAGEGRRLQPLTYDTPKVMLPVANRPILHYVVDALVSAGVRDIVLVVGYHADKIRRYFGDGLAFSASISYVVQEKQLGTAHALYQAGPSDDVIVLPGDNIISPDCVRMMLEAGPNTILATYSRNPSKYGAIEHEGGRLLRITEKPPGAVEALVFTGLGHYDGSIFRHLSGALDDGIYDMTTVLNRMSGVNVLVSDCVWKDAVYPWDLLELNSWAMRSVQTEMSGTVENAIITGNVRVGEGTVISGGSYIRGPVVIGKNCYIGPNTVILGNTAIGNDVRIGAMSFIKNSIVMPSSTIHHRADIEDTVIGSGNEVGAGTVMMSARWQRVVDGEVMSSDTGPVIGSDCRIGPRVTIYPGVRISSGSRVRPEASIKEDIGPREEVV